MQAMEGAATFTNPDDLVKNPLPGSKESDDLCSDVMDELRSLQKESDRFDWIGVYWLKGQTLALGEFIGERPIHDQIQVGEGVCGTAVAENADQIIADVTQVENYLSCGLGTRSEIVVLIKDEQGEILGQIDIDSKSLGAFKPSEVEAVRRVARKLGEKWKK